METYTVDVRERSERARFESRYSIRSVGWYGEDEARSLGYVRWSPAHGRDRSLLGVSYTLRTIDNLYILVTPRLDSKGIQQTSDILDRLRVMNIKFGAWVGLEVEDVHYDIRAMFAFRYKKDAAMYRLVWG